MQVSKDEEQQPGPGIVATLLAPANLLMVLFMVVYNAISNFYIETQEAPYLAQQLNIEFLATPLLVATGSQAPNHRPMMPNPTLHITQRAVHAIITT